MENTDVFGSSTAPLTWHDFLERMRQPSAADFVKAIKSFIVSFLNNAPDPERDSEAVQDFLSNMEAAFRAHSLWAGCSEEELDSAGEGLEKYVMTKLFTRVYASLPDEVNVDKKLHQKVALIQQFIRPENLDILPTYQNETSWLLAQKELQKINMYKAPRDKLVCILNCCKVINNLLLNSSIASNENPPGADEFLPVLIYVTIKANPPQLHSNLLYIQRYRRQSRLVSEAAYFFTNMLSAESFIININAKSLSMEQTEFEKNMEFAQALIFSPSSDSDDTPSQSDQSVGPKQESINYKEHQGTAAHTQVSPQSSETKSRNDKPHSKDPYSLNKIQTISDLENRGATMLLKDENANRVFQDFPYLYAQAGDLTINDVEELLNNYKQLAFKYVCLSKGVGVSITPPSSSHVETLNEPEDTRAVESSEEKHEDLFRTDDSSDGASKFGVENSESKSTQDEDVAALMMIIPRETGKYAERDRKNGTGLQLFCRERDSAERIGTGFSRTNGTGIFLTEREFSAERNGTEIFRTGGKNLL